MNFFKQIKGVSFQIYQTTCKNPNPKGQIEHITLNLSGQNHIRATCILEENPMGENPKNRVGENPKTEYYLRELVGDLLLELDGLVLNFQTSELGLLVVRVHQLELLPLALGPLLL